ncbi:MAG: hypothetical protein EXR36_03030 [Betaproteobacteria bacterium]|nr:hypothetical protein [Betaproteobacteria bacterium]
MNPHLLFAPLALGAIHCANRIAMAPMTSNRAGAGNVPGELNALYYAQRASAGLIVTEASQISEQGVGYSRTPGIHTAGQIADWKPTSPHFSQVAPVMHTTSPNLPAASAPTMPLRPTVGCAGAGGLRIRPPVMTLALRSDETMAAIVMEKYERWRTASRMILQQWKISSSYCPVTKRNSHDKKLDNNPNCIVGGGARTGGRATVAQCTRREAGISGGRNRHCRRRYRRVWFRKFRGNAG